MKRNAKAKLPTEVSDQEVNLLLEPPVVPTPNGTAANGHHSEREDLETVRKSLKGELILPDFEGFRNDISEIYEMVRQNNAGAVASYIPQLATVDPKLFAVSLCTVDGQEVSFGDHQTKFSLQSTHKPINYAIALEELGAEEVHQHIGKEPSGASFNELTLNRLGLPHNPLINAGAIMCAALIMRDLQAADKFERLQAIHERLHAYGRPSFNNSIYLSERETADRNYALAYFMRENGAFPGGTDIPSVMDFYFQCCSMESTSKQMARIAATYANSGINPFTNERVFGSQTVKSCLTMMNTSGMYDFSGEFAFTIGLPAKSGVSGAIWIVVPNVMGICIYSPLLDGNGNSVRGIQFATELLKRFNFHTYDSLNHEQDGKKDPRRKKYQTKATEVMQLIFAASAGDINEVKRIHNEGTSVNDADYDGRTALHLAAAENHLEVVRYLIAHGARTQAKDRWGGTPVTDAKRAGHNEIIQAIKDLQEK